MKHITKDMINENIAWMLWLACRANLLLRHHAWSCFQYNFLSFHVHHDNSWIATNIQVFKIWMILGASNKIWMIRGASIKIWMILGASNKIWMILGPSNKIWMSLGPSNKIWMILEPSNKIWMILGWMGHAIKYGWSLIKYGCLLGKAMKYGWTLGLQWVNDSIQAINFGWSLGLRAI